jgi:hypothetical protein
MLPEIPCNRIWIETSSGTYDVCEQQVDMCECLRALSANADVQLPANLPPHQLNNLSADDVSFAFMVVVFLMCVQLFDQFLSNLRHGTASSEKQLAFTSSALPAGILAPLFSKQAVDALSGALTHRAAIAATTALLVGGLCKVCNAVAKELQGPVFTPVAQVHADGCVLRNWCRQRVCFLRVQSCSCVCSGVPS